MSDLESERTGIAFQVGAIIWFLAAGVAQGIWDATIGQPWLLVSPVFCAGCSVYVWVLGHKERRRSRDHHEFMEKHRRWMANFAQRDKAIWS